MKIHKSYKFRLKPTDEQIAVLKQHGGNGRFVWNKLLDFSNEIKKDTGKIPNQSDLQKKIIELKRENDFLKLSHSQPIQINAAKMVETFKKAFKPETISGRNKKIAQAHKIEDEDKKKKALAKALNFGFPKFKSKNDNHDSIFYPQNFKIRKSRIFLAKIGWINYIKHRVIEGNPKFVTVTQDGDRYYVSITSEIEIMKPQKVPLDQANIIGIDVGLKSFAVFSDGTVIENPKPLKRYLKKIKRESRRLSRKQLKPTGKIVFGKEIKESSHNRDKQIEKNRKLYRKVRDIRHDFHHKLTHDMTTKYDGFILEDLDIEEMLDHGNHAMNRFISDAGWGEFMRILSYKSDWCSKYFCKVSQYFPSTKKCSVCGELMDLSLDERVYICQHCGAVIGRDFNSATNMKVEGLRILNTAATAEIQACGPPAIADGRKQEKLWQQKPILAFA